MENTSSTTNTRRAYTIGIAICAFALLTFAIFLVVEPAYAARFGLDAAAPKNLPKTSLTGVIANIISAVLGFVGVLFLGLMLYAGLMWMTARGNAERAEKARDTISRAVIGLIIIASAYAITSFVIEKIAAPASPSSGESSLIESSPSFGLIPTAHAQGLGQGLLEEVGEKSGVAGKDLGDASEQLPTLIGRYVKAFMGVLGIVFLFLTIYGGWLWLTARGEAERVEKAKSTLTRAIIGLVIIFSSYAITGFVISKLIEGPK